MTQQWASSCRSDPLQCDAGCLRVRRREPLDGTDPSGLSSGYYPGTYEGECNDQIALMLQTQAIKQHKKLTTSQLQTEIKAVDTQDDQATISRQLQQIAAEDKADPTVAKDAENALKTGGKSGWGVLAMIACTLATGGAGGAVADVAEGLTDVAVEMTADMSADAVEGVEAAAPSEMTGFTQHGLEQAMTHDGGLGVSDSAMEDAVQNPTKVVPQANGTCQFVGKDATVVLNKDGQVVTTWAGIVPVGGTHHERCYRGAPGGDALSLRGGDRSCGIQVSSPLS